MDTVNLEKAVPGFRDEVAAKIGLQEIKPCYTCGSCTGICPVREVIDDFDPRRLIHMIIMGMREEILSSDLIWFCCRCNSCYFVCPQGIKFSRIAAELQKTAIDEEFVDEAFLKRFTPVQDYLIDLCRRTMFDKVKHGLRGPQKMPCWLKNTCKE